MTAVKTAKPTVEEPQDDHAISYYRPMQPEDQATAPRFVWEALDAHDRAVASSFTEPELVSMCDYIMSHPTILHERQFLEFLDALATANN
jgi:hypothetical protein